MKKLRYLIATFMAAIAFVALGVGFKANAVSYSTDKKTATWTIGKNCTDADGLLVGNSATYADITTVTSCTSYSIQNLTLLIPVPASSAGTLTILGSDTTTDRYAYLLYSTGLKDENSPKILMTKTKVENNFTVSNIITRDAKTYLGVSATDAFKIGSVIVTLTTGAYDASTDSGEAEEGEESTTTYTVNFYDYDAKTIISTKSVVKNATVEKPSNPTYSGEKNATFEKWVDASGNEYDFSSAVTKDLDLHAIYTYDDGYDVTDSNHLENSTILKQVVERGYNTVALASDLEVTGTIFTLGKGLTPSYKSSNTTIDGHAFYYDLKTNGATTASTKYIKFTASEAGTLVAYVKNGSTSSTREVNVFKSGTTTAASTPQTLAINDSTGAGEGKLLFDISEAGTYTFGSTAGTIYIYDLEFVPGTLENPVLEQQFTSDGTAVRYVATLATVADLSQIKGWYVKMTLDGAQEYSTYTEDDDTTLFKTVYTAVKAKAEGTGKEEAAHTYYLVATQFDIPVNDETKGKVIACTFYVILEDGTTELTSNTKYYTIGNTSEE